MAWLGEERRHVLGGLDLIAQPRKLFEFARWSIGRIAARATASMPGAAVAAATPAPATTCGNAGRTNSERRSDFSMPAM
jgi:hypothetical protein